MASIGRLRDVTVGDAGQDGLIDAIVDVQRRSLEAAAALVDRFIAQPEAPAEATPGPERPAADLVGGWAQMVRDSLANLTSATASPGVAPMLEVGPEARASAVPLMVRGDATSSVELWVHNRGDAALGELELWATPPTSSSGATLAADAVAFDPPVVELLARSSRGVRITVDPGEASPGRYHSIVLARQLTDQCVMLAIDVPGDTA